MKRNQSGLYKVLEGGVFLEDTETGEKMLFLFDSEKKVVIRSMLEDDIKSAVNLYNISPSEKRRRRKEIWRIVQKQGAEEKAFVLEKIIGQNSSNSYEKDRKLIGIGIREGNDLEIDIPNQKEANPNVFDVMQKLADRYGIKGKPQLIL